MAEPTSKGRGAVLKKLREHKEMVARGEPQEEMPPKSRGRAQVLQKLQRLKESGRPGGDTASTVSTPPPTSVPSGSRRSGEQVAQIETGVSELSVATSEPVSFKGSSGTTIATTANYIMLHVEEDRGVFEYEVRFSPELDAKSNRVRLVNQILSEMATTKLYDGDVCLYMPSQAWVGARHFDSVIPNTDIPVKATIIFKRKRKLSECLHLYNVLFKRIMMILLYQRMGRNYFSPDRTYTVPQHKLEIFPGYAIHVDEMEGGLMVCLDTTHRVIRTQTVYDHFQELRAANPRTFKEEARKVIGQTVLTRYNNMTYVIDDISWEMNPRHTFQQTRTGTTYSYVDYYKNHHNITIHDIEQPLLVNLRKKKIAGGQDEEEHKICLIPELCYMTGLTDVMRDDFRVMKDVGMYTRVTPNQRAQALKEWIRKVQQSEMAQKALRGWGLQLAGGSIDLPARVLDQEVLVFGGDRHVKCGPEWNRPIVDNTVTGPVDIKVWQLYYTRRDQKNASNFAEMFVRLARGMGCMIHHPEHIVLENDRTETYMTAIRSNARDTTEVAVFVVPNQREDRYSIIKKLCCVDIPIASQVILSKTLADPKKIRNIIHKIGLQITCKLGGTLWNVKIPVDKWMICGIDAYHGANRQSVCGFVASINRAHTRYFSQAFFQGNEIGDFYRVAFMNCLNRYNAELGHFPKRIVVYRDGVGDGQLDHCRQYEVAQMLDVIKLMTPETLLIFVVVQKRINTRFYRLRPDGECENPPTGTIVDTTITRRNLPDFYLVPQGTRQGTVNPTHYIVIHDDAKVNPDHIQKLAFKLCHLYYNWSGTVKVPAPCLYAHKLAAMVGQFMKKTADHKLDDRLWFL